eukprot:CAMPEP_0170280576 /NCGR_PEP_ID=MMETSP0116_2-20130129/40302_1 /TAXON_ID=400756 /ORGANISM="Durinskia baltica, Strain CSIRO CS-38" /LENGTH=55 /DNA_ID=CAMNT_0010531907 /DNA_START=613 /DNA_END=776 /DNA_ORIENTATION=-
MAPRGVMRRMAAVGMAPLRLGPEGLRAKRGILAAHGGEHVPPRVSRARDGLLLLL